MLVAVFRNQMSEFRLNILIAYTTGGRAREHYESRGKGYRPECGEHTALYAMSRNRKPGNLLRYDNRVSLSLLWEDNGKMRRREAPPALKRRREQRPRKPFAAREHRVRRRGACARRDDVSVRSCGLSSFSLS
jgi:hypothetical protein